jgi:hypothetical protein
MTDRSFLDQWDEALADALDLGCEQFVWRSWIVDGKTYNLQKVARTRHPAFMGGRIPPKYDPERDRITGHGRNVDISGHVES